MPTETLENLAIIKFGGLLHMAVYKKNNLWFLYEPVCVTHVMCTLNRHTLHVWEQV